MHILIDKFINLYHISYAALLKYMQMHAFAYILTRLFIAMQLIAMQ